MKSDKLWNTFLHRMRSEGFVSQEQISYPPSMKRKNGYSVQKLFQLKKKKNVTLPFNS